jgi:hypothetical protein
MVSSAQVKPYEGRAEAFIHPFPQSCSPNCDYQCPGGNIWEKSAGKYRENPVFVMGKGQGLPWCSFPKGRRRCLKMYGSQWIILPYTIAQTNGEDGNTHLLSGWCCIIHSHHPGFGAHAYPMTWGQLPMEHRALARASLS